MKFDLPEEKCVFCDPNGVHLKTIKYRNGDTGIAISDDDSITCAMINKKEWLELREKLDEHFGQGVGEL